VLLEDELSLEDDELLDEDEPSLEDELLLDDELSIDEELLEEDISLLEDIDAPLKADWCNQSPPDLHAFSFAKQALAVNFWKSSSNGQCQS
jgi:hypothetical protein